MGRGCGLLTPVISTACLTEQSQHNPATMETMERLATHSGVGEEDKARDTMKNHVPGQPIHFNIKKYRTLRMVYISIPNSKT